MQSNAFGAILRQKRLAKGITLRRFAAAIGASPTYVCHIELGKVKPPTPKRIKKIAAVLEEDPDDLMVAARRVPPDLLMIIMDRPAPMVALLRAAKMLSMEKIQKLIDSARKMR